MRTIVKTAGYAATLIAIVFGALLGLLYVGQESLIFAGEPLPPNHEFAFDIPFEEVALPTQDAVLNGLHFKQDSPRGLFFFLHGNGGNLQSWTTGADYYRRVNYDMFMFDYRGYGKSTGEITSEAQLHEDVRLVWDAITAQYDDKPIVLFGRSLGAALAAKLATEVDAELVVLVSPFTSMLEMAASQYPFVPDALVRYPFRNDLFVPSIRSPLLLIHGDRDRLIPLDHSRQLLQRAQAPARLLVVEGANHNDIHRFPSYIDGLTDALPR